MKKNDNVFQETLNQIKYTWRHRPGQEIVGIILDTIDNLNLETKDGRKPVLAGKKKTDYGWHLVFKLPPGISFAQMKRKQDFFSDAIQGWCDVEWLNGLCHIDVQINQLPRKLDYDWNPEQYLGKMDLPVPIGVTPKGPIILDLASSPHLLVAGISGFGKSNFLHVLINSLMDIAKIAVIDLKRLEFSYLDGKVLLAKNERDSLELLSFLNEEHDRRASILEKANVVKVQDYPGDDMPYIVVVIDEVAELRDDETKEAINRLLRLARATGISIVSSTQRPSVKVIDGDSRGQFAARLCYLVADETNSRIVLGEECSRAAWLQPIKGRAIFKFGTDIKEVQTMHLPYDRARELASNHKGEGWQIEFRAKRLPAR